MRPTRPTHEALLERKRSGGVASSVVSHGARTLVPRCLLVGLAVAFSVPAGVASADSRGACVDSSATSVTSTPTAAPVSLDEERVAWVTGAWMGLERGLVPSRHQAAPAWCETGDGPACDPGGEAPVQQQHAASSGVGAIAPIETPVARFVLRTSPSAHPPIEVGVGADGRRGRLERPPR